MKNKIFLKIASIFVSIIALYVIFMVVIISPRITQYVINSEITHAKAQLDRINSVINVKEQNLRKRKKGAISESKKDIRNISLIIYNILKDNYNLLKNGEISKDEVLNRTTNSISKIKYGSMDDYIFILDTKGNLIYHPDLDLKNKNIYLQKDREGEYFINKLIKNSMENKETYTQYVWTKLNSNEDSEKIVHSVYFEPLGLIISTGISIENINKKLELERKNVLESLFSLINSITIDNYGYIFIMNNKNIILHHFDSKFLNKDISNLKSSQTGSYFVDEIKDSYSKKTIWEYMWNKPNEPNNYEHKKIAIVEYNQFFDWYIVATMYEEELEKRASELESIIIKISILFLLLVLILAMTIVKKLLRPITIMTENAKHVKNGDFTVRNDIKSNDEIGILANHFDKMLDYIEENTKDLENKVEERTIKLKHRLYHDELTGFKNRFCLEKDIKELDFCSLTLIDIKGFNDINELYGFEIGNQILLTVSKVLKEFSKENDVFLYKLNADIFAILDKNMQLVINYESVIDKIRILFSESIYVKELGTNINLQVVMGISIAQEEPIQTANMALQKAKKMGAQYLVYSTDIDTKENIEQSMYWQMKIKDAIENDKIIPFFQAIYNKNKEIVKYETLMRLYDETNENKYISPGKFLGIACKTGQYFKLNQIVIKKAFENIETINNSISINLGFNEIWSLDFTDFIDKQMDSLSEKNRKKIVFEILESDFITDYKVFEGFISKYRNKGVKIAIDDFGTGYSNFEHILKIKPDYIKIDGSLIKNIHKDDNSYEMVKSIVAFSKSLGIKNIAEFIHCQEVYEVAQSLEIDEYQGFYLGEPEPLI